jgi:surfactin family lipopeptide synthetase A
VHDPVSRPTPISEALPLSETKRQLLEKYRRGELPPSYADRKAVPRRPVGAPTPLSLAQEQVWLNQMAAPGAPPFYNESITLHRHGPLEALALERSLLAIIERHEIWRTTYDRVHGRAVQVVHPAPSAFSLPLVDLRQLPLERREAEALRLATEQAGQPFDLKKGPLLRATLVTLADQEHRLFLTMHQSIVDGVSVYQVLPLELTSLYGAFSTGKPCPLAELPRQHADFAYWERTSAQTDLRDGQRAYWRSQLAGPVERLAWPARGSSSRSFRGAIHPFEMSKQLTAEMKQISQQEGVTLFMTLTAGFAALLQHYTGQQNILIGTMGPGGRKRPEVQKLLGYFLNPLALRIAVARDSTFRQWLRQVREVVLGALAHDDLPLESVEREVDPRSDAGRPPLFQVVITLAPPVPDLGPGWSQTVMDVESGGSRWDLYLEFSERREGLMGRAQYNPDIFAGAVIEQTIADLERVLREGLRNPGQPLAPWSDWTPDGIAPAV